MNAGDLQHRIDLQRPTETRGPGGDVVTTFATAFSVWAAVKPLRGRELMVADQVKYEVDTRIVVRWSSEVDQVDAEWRLLHGAVAYNIKAVIHVDMAREEIQFMCNRGVKEI